MQKNKTKGSLARQSMAAAALVAVLGTAPAGAADAVVCPGCDDPTPGVDVSVFSGPVDRSAVAGAGYGFGIARATWGASLVDTRFAANWSGMRTAGLVRGAYAYFVPWQDPVAQARAYLAAVGPFGAGGPGRTGVRPDGHGALGHGPHAHPGQGARGVARHVRAHRLWRAAQRRGQLRRRPVGGQLERSLPRRARRLDGLAVLAEGDRSRRSRHSRRCPCGCVQRPGGSPAGLCAGQSGAGAGNLGDDAGGPRPPGPRRAAPPVRDPSKRRTRRDNGGSENHRGVAAAHKVAASPSAHPNGTAP
ncbi:MAG: hypothetical protein JNM82_14090 [Rhodocyclaceae bacterium]|nr:hypothetical protein [Rhodocyclaceae bacterium]